MSELAGWCLLHFAQMKAPLPGDQIPCIILALRRSGRVVEGGGLENRCTRKGTVGSNPTSSAKSYNHLADCEVTSPTTFNVLVDLCRPVFVPFPRPSSTTNARLAA